MASSSKSNSQGSCPAPPADDAPHAVAEQVVRTDDDYMEKVQNQIRAPEEHLCAEITKCKDKATRT